jgi:hypothetical protein
MLLVYSKKTSSRSVLGLGAVVSAVLTVGSFG